MASGLPGFQWRGQQPSVFDIEPALAATSFRNARLSSGEDFSLLAILNKVRRCDTTNALDRVFAIQGLCGEQEREANPPEYPDTQIQPLIDKLGEVFIRFAWNHILVHRDLNVLCLATEAARIQRRRERWLNPVSNKYVNPTQPGQPEPIFIPRLPTWVPNLTSVHAWWVFGPDTSGDGRAMFRASDQYQPQIQNADFVLRTGELQVRGIEIDCVADVQENTPIPHPTHRDSTSQLFENIWLFAWSHWWQNRSSYRDALCLLTAFCRNISAGGRRSGTPEFLSDQYLRYYFVIFFQGTQLGKFFRRIVEDAYRPHNQPIRPSDPRDWYADPEGAVRYNDEPTVDLDKLPFNVFAWTAKGRMALLPVNAVEGDRICVLFGCSSPLLLLPHPTRSGAYISRGEAFVHGFMFGEAIREWEAEQRETKMFTLV